MVARLASGASVRKNVEVQVLSRAPKERTYGNNPIHPGIRGVFSSMNERAFSSDQNFSIHGCFIHCISIFVIVWLEYEYKR